MGSAALTIAVAMLLMLLPSSLASPFYMVTAPNMIHADDDEMASVMATGLTSDVTVYVHLENPVSGRQYGHRRLNLTNNELRNITIKVPSDKLGASGIGRHYVRLVATSSIDGQRMRKEVLILVGPRSRHVFIQTDKPIYSPGQQVHIRVFTTDKNTNAIGIPVTLEIWDPHDSAILHAYNASHSGIVAHSYTLPTMALTGKWRITAKIDGKKEKNVQIEVKPYALPSFGVDIRIDDRYILNTTETIVVHVNARYSFDRNVRGSARVEFRIARAGVLIFVTYDRALLRNGSAVFKLRVREVTGYTEDLRFPKVVGSRLQVDAIVIERASGRREQTTNRQCMFAASPHVVEPAQTPVSSQPRLDFDINVLGEEAFFRIRFETHAQPDVFFFQVLGRGSILQQGLQKRRTGSRLPEVTFSIRVTDRMAPSARLLVWYVKGQDVVADSRTFYVNNTCRNAVTVGGVQRAFSPGAQTHLSITAAAGAKVSLIAVDKAVYFLNQQDILTKDEMFRDVGKNDLTCGAGGGSDVHDVFAKSGLVALTGNDAIRTPARKQENCQEDGRENIGGGWIGNRNCCRDGDQFSRDLPGMDTHAKSRQCRIKAFSLSSSEKCINDFSRCCIRSLAINVSEFRVSSSSESRANSRDVDMDLHDGEAGNSDTIGPDTRYSVQSHFPESWLFETIQLPNISGNAKIPVTLPDSITTWVFHAVSTSPIDGMCVAEPYEATVAQKVFLRVNLPKSAILGEQLEVEATVFNTYPYREGDFPRYAGVSIRCTSDICVPRPHEHAGEWCNQKTFFVHNERSHSVTWPVVPLRAGRFVLTIRLQVYGRPGAVLLRKNLTVTRGGIEERNSFSILLSPATQAPLTSSLNHSMVKVRWDTAVQKQSIDLETRLPPMTITRSLRRTITFTGDVMAPLVMAMRTGDPTRQSSSFGLHILSDLGRGLAVFKYLKGSRQMTPELEKQTTRVMSRGIGEMMQLRNADGGFAQWKSEQSSLWLTALTVQVLARIQSLECDTVLRADSSGVVRTAAEWLRSRESGGSFRPTPTTDGARQSPQLDRIMATVGVLDAMIVPDFDDEPSIGAKRRALTYVLRHLEDVTSPLHLAKISHSLALAGMNECRHVSDKLMAMAHCESDVTGVGKACHWLIQDDGTAAANGDSRHSRPPSFAEVETSGYALLTQMLLNDEGRQDSIANWLLRENRLVLGLLDLKGVLASVEALGEYSLRRRPRRDASVRYNFRSSRDTSARQTSSLEDSTRLTPQTYDISNLGDDTVYVEATGNGIGFLHVDMVYLVHEEISHSAYKITVTVNKFDPFSYDFSAISDARSSVGRDPFSQPNLVLRACVRYVGVPGSGVDPHGRVSLDVGLHSGYEPEEASLTQTESEFYEHHESSTRSVIFFLKKVSTSGPVCVRFEARKTSEVRNVKPVSVRLHSLTGEKLGEQFYHAETEQAVVETNCDRSRGPLCECVKEANECSTCYGIRIGETLPPHGDDLRAMIQNNYTFAFNIKVTDIYVTRVISNVGKVRKIYKQDCSVDIYKGFSVTFRSNPECPCPNFEVGHTYLILGNQLSGSYLHGFTFDLDRSTFVLERYATNNRSPHKKLITRIRRFINQLEEHSCL